MNSPVAEAGFIEAVMPRVRSASLPQGACDAHTHVFEHMGMLEVGEGVHGRHFRTMLGLVREGRVWVKLSVCRCSVRVPGYEDLRPFTAALLHANPERLLWGSDWPFIRMQGREPDVSGLLDVLLDSVDDAGLQRKILVDNPTALCGFDPVSPVPSP